MSLWRKYGLGVRVIATFLFLIVAFFFVLTWGPIVDRVDVGAGLAKMAAWLSFGLLWLLGFLFGYDVAIDGTVMISGDFRVDVAPACSGAVATSIYVSAVLAYPAAWAAKLKGSLLGVLTIFLVNVLRVAALFLIGLYFEEIFHETHVYVAQSVLVCFAVALWLYWVIKFADAPPTQSPA